MASLKGKIDEKFYKGDQSAIACTVGELKALLEELPDHISIHDDCNQVVVFNVDSDPILGFVEEDY